MLAVMNLASETMDTTSSRPSFLIFQFLSSILDTSSAVIFSLHQEAEDRCEQTGLTCTPPPLPHT